MNRAAGIKLYLAKVIAAALLLVFFSAPPAQAAAVRLVRTSPELQRARPGEVVTHVFVAYGEGIATPTFRSQNGWPILSQPAPLQLDAQRPAYLAVSVRVPADALEGARDRLTVRLDGAEAHAVTEVAFQPGLEARWPDALAFTPPVSYLPLRLVNGGNGRDTFAVVVADAAGDEVLSLRVALDAGEERQLRLPIAAEGAYRLVVRSLRSGLQKRGAFVAAPAAEGAGGRFHLAGELGATYALFGGFSTHASLAGPLSDYARLRLGVGYVPGRLPTGAAALTFDRGYLTASYSPAGYGAAAGYRGRGYELTVTASGPQPRATLNADFARGRVRYGLAAILTDPSAAAPAQLRADVAAAGLLEPLDALSSELTLQLGEPRVEWTAAYRYHPRGRPLRFSVGALWDAREGPGFTLAADADPGPLTLGGYVRRLASAPWDWGLSAWSSSARLGLEATRPFYLGLRLDPEQGRAFAGTALALPHPWDELKGEVAAGFDPEGAWFTVAASTGVRLPGWPLALGFEGTAGWPAENNRLVLRARGRQALVGGQAVLEWAPWAEGLRARLDVEAPLGPVLLEARAGYTLPAGEASLTLGARLPLAAAVPEGVSDLFGGRRLGVVEGRVVVEGAGAKRPPVVVRAGGYTVRTDAEGRFRLELPPGEYTVEIDRGSLPAGFVVVRGEAKVRVRPREESRVELRIALQAVIEGRVRVEGEAPERGLRFAVAVRDGQGREATLFTDEGGRFWVEGLRPGTYTVALLEGLLPPGWRPGRAAVTLRLEPGETARVELTVRPPERRTRTGEVQILSAACEAPAVPPGAEPLVVARVRGPAARVDVVWRERVLAILHPVEGEEGLWEGRLRVPAGFSGALDLQARAAGEAGEARFPFFVTVSPNAPWGELRAPSVARPGWSLNVAVHWYAPVEGSWLELGDRRLLLTGRGADWRGTLELPPGLEGRVRLVAKARRRDGRVIEVARYLLVVPPRDER